MRMTRSWRVMVTCPFLALAVAGSCIDRPAEQPVTTVFIVRHAEKVDESADPDLSEEGLARARLLAEMLARVPVGALYATQYKRTQQTLSPVASQANLPIQQLQADQTEQLVEAILQRHRGEMVVVAGHSNTVPQIVNGLAGTDYESLSEGDYDNLFVVTIGASGATVLPLRFGLRLAP